MKGVSGVGGGCAQMVHVFKNGCFTATCFAEIANVFIVVDLVWLLLLWVGSDATGRG